MVSERTGRTDSESPVAFAEERQRLILSILADRGRIRNAELAKLLGVTEPTIRRDVADLAVSRKLTRTHGGAIAMRPQLEPDLPMRISTEAPAKSAIARACISLISDGDAVFFDSGSTVLKIAECLTDESIPDRPRNVNVLTNAMPVAVALSPYSDYRTTVVGGTYRPTGTSFSGPLAIQTLESFSVNIAFLGVTGLTDNGITVSDLAEAQLKEAVIAIAKHVVIAMDITKVGAVDFAKVCALDVITTIVTNERNTHLESIAQKEGIQLIVAQRL